MTNVNTKDESNIHTQDMNIHCAMTTKISEQSNNLIFCKVLIGCETD